MAETVNNFPIEQAHVVTFTANVMAALARQPGMLVGRMSGSSYIGDKAQVVNFIGPIAFVRQENVYQPTTPVEVEHTQRWITADDYNAAVLIDNLDKLRMIWDPTSPYVEEMRRGAARTQDDIAAAAFFADARTGKQGVTSTTFRAANAIADGGTGMTTAKLRSLRKLMKKSFVDLRAERPMVGVTADEVDGLLAETVVGSFDYNSLKPLNDGEITSWFGFDLVPLEGLPAVAPSGGVRQCPAWVSSGMHFGTWQAPVMTINQRPDLNNIYQLHGRLTMGATRLDESKVYKVGCAGAT